MFVAITVILVIELAGVQTNHYNKKLQLLPQENIVTPEQACSSLPKRAVLLWNSNDTASVNAYEQFTVILDDMKVGRDTVDLSKDDLPKLDKYSQVIVLMGNLEPLGQSVITVCDWVKNGGRAWFPMTLEHSVCSNSILQMLGVNDISPSYKMVESIYVYEEFMIGGGKAFAVADPFDSSRTVVLSDKSTTVYASEGTPDGVPLVWRTEYGEGIFVVDNIGIYDKVMRGFYAASYSLLDDICVYPVINASAVFLDDFPSQIPSGVSEYIHRDYNTTTRDFYINIWWPDMMNFADDFGLKYTGLAIQSYDNSVDGSTTSATDTGTFMNFGNMLLRKGGEIGYHGYNHQPLALSNKDYKDLYDYKTWESEEAMKRAFDELVDTCDTLFPDTEFSVYVPPSNLLSQEGRDFLLREYPHIKTISGIYFDDVSEEELGLTCTQEFRVDENGIVDLPRISSSFIVDDFQNLAAISELNMHYVHSHFVHPDDALDPERGALVGWEKMKKTFYDYIVWLYDSAPSLRNFTGTETAAAIQRFCAIAPSTEVFDDSMKITIGNFYDDAQMLVRFNTKQPDKVKGGSLSHITGNIYLLSANESVVDITLK